jgi:nitric oxide synthase oxygenase domain/subunit
MSELIDFLNQYYESLNKFNILNIIFFSVLCLEFILLFRKNSDEHINRLKQLINQYNINKKHHLTTKELEFACKNAWRNSARCIGRINWQNLKVKTF